MVRLPCVNPGAAKGVDPVPTPLDAVRVVQLQPLAGAAEPALATEPFDNEGAECAG